MTPNERAAKWWADLFGLKDKREEFRLALLKLLPAEYYVLENDYEPKGILLDAVHAVVPNYDFTFSDIEIFPFKTVMIYECDQIWVKRGHSMPFEELTD